MEHLTVAFRRKGKLRINRLWNVLVRPVILPVVLALAACFPAAVPAHADQFRFIFTTNALLDALQTANGDAFSRDGYFAIFLQFDPIDVPNVTSMAGVTTPYNLGSNPDGWVTGNYTDSGNLFLGGNYVRFSKDATQSTTRLVTSTNIFTGYDFPLEAASSGAWPVDFGPQATITGLIPNGYFELELVTDDVIPGPVTIHGFASAIRADYPEGFPPEYGAPNFYGGKPVSGLSFTMRLHAVPEPGTFVMLGIGLAGAVTLGIRRKKRFS
jgi:hypothetical protein